MASDYILKIDGIKGESTDKAYKGEIDVESFSWGASNDATPGVGGGLGAGRVQMQDLMVTMRLNSACPKLMLHAATGAHVKTATLIARKAAGDQQKEFLKITLDDLVVASYQESGAHTGGLPMVSVGLNFAKVALEYIEQKADGSMGAPVKAGWDTAKRVKF